jgi:hypothetical protein
MTDRSAFTDEQWHALTVHRWRSSWLWRWSVSTVPSR